VLNDMNERRLIHLSTSNKFLPLILESFHRALPDVTQRVHVYKTSSQDLQSIECEQIRFSDLLPIFSGGKFRENDVVILHSLSPLWVHLILTAHPSVRFIWLGFGGDYYSLFQDADDFLYTDSTQRFMVEQCDPSGSLTVVGKCKRFVKDSIRKLLFDRFIPEAIGRINKMCLCYPGEYDLIRSHVKNITFPPYQLWAVANVEGEYVNETFDSRGGNILVGNSADPANNHIDIIDLLKDKAVERGVILPLSYGNASYAKALNSYGSRALGEKYHSIMQFQPLGEYQKTLNSCGFAIFNHNRQQAVMNMVMLLARGVKLFLKVNAPSYKFLLSLGVIIYTIDELENDPSLLDDLLTVTEKKHNYQCLKRHWCNENIDRYILQMVEGSPEGDDSNFLEGACN